MVYIVFFHDCFLDFNKLNLLNRDNENMPTTLNANYAILVENVSYNSRFI